jgi:lipoprotein signal peptidase
VFKLLLLFAHLLGTSLALGAIVATDIRLLRRLADDRVRIAPPNPFVMRLITVALLLLYATGFAMVAFGVADDPNYLSNPKLQAKLVLIAVLSINALVLHRYTFPGLARGRRVARWKVADFMRVAVPVSLSNCLWMYCAFLGIARPWNHGVSFGFVLGTAGWLFAAMLAAVTTILVIAAQDRTDAEPGWIDVLKRQFGALATALRA